MADQKIRELTALTGANLADVDAFAVVDTSAVQTKKITYAELKTALDTGTGFVRITGDTMTGALVAPTINVSGNIDVDGTSNLDVVDIDGALTQDGGAVFNEASADVDFRVESNGNANMLFVDSGNNAVGIGHASPTAALDVRRSDASGIVGEFHNNVGYGIDIGTSTADAYISSGYQQNFIFKTNPGSGQVERFKIDKDGAATFNSTIAATSATFTTADNSAQLTLVSTDTDANAAPHLNLYRNATGADSDGLGQVEFTGKDDAGNDFIYAQIEAYISDASNGSEDGYFEIFRGVGGTERVSGMILSSTDTVFNENSAGVDFRVESNGNANMLFVDSGNNAVGIGLATPAKPLEVSSNDFQLRISTGSEPTNYYTQFSSAYNSTAPFKIQGYYNGTTVDFLKITAAGGFASPVLQLGNGMSYVSLYSGSTEHVVLHNAGLSVNETGADFDFRVESDANTHAFFLNGGDGLISFGSATTVLTTGTSFVAGDNYALYSGVDATTTRNHCVFGNANGYIGSITTNGIATAYNTSSDQRLKENIADADDSGELIDAIQVRKFDWKTDGSHQDYGMVAQELQTVAPEAVSAPENPDEMMSVDYSKLVPMLIKEIQTLRARVADLES